MNDSSVAARTYITRLAQLGTDALGQTLRVSDGLAARVHFGVYRVDRRDLFEDSR